jgi:hypothetical protein
VFPSGKVLVTGVTTIKDAESAFNALADILLNRDSDHSLGMPQPDWYCQHPNPENPLAVLEKLDDKRKPTAEAPSQRKKRNIKAPPSSAQTDRWSVDKWIDLFKADLVQQIQEAEETQGTLTTAAKKVRTPDNRVNRAAVQPDLIQPQALFKEKETGASQQPPQSDLMVVDDCDIYPFDLGPLMSTEGSAAVVPITEERSTPTKPTVSVAVQTEPITNDQKSVAGGPVVVEEQSQPTAVMEVVTSEEPTDQAVARSLTPVIAGAHHNHLYLSTFLLCKTCKGRVMVGGSSLTESSWVETANGSYQLNMEVCAGCHSLNKDWSDLVCI